MSKTIIYLGDLVHNAVVKGPFTVPLNIGYIAAYTKKRFAKDVDIKLFKYPLDIMNAVKERPPHILALGNYAWNADLNYKIIELSKKYSQSLVAVLGGPNFPINEDEQRDYLAKRPLIDFYVTGEGEPGFLNLIDRLIGSSGDIKRLKAAPINGCVFLDRGRQRLIIGERDELKSLDEVPSPYLSGILDDFFKMNLIPIIETDRGCPYTCTFCAWRKSANGRIREFDIARVKAELDYITEKIKNTNMLFVANANFGIFERDTEIAEYIKQHHIRSGYPRMISAAWAKNTTKRIIDMAETLGDMVTVTMSFQSLDPEVLKNIKRSNIKTSSFIEIQDHFAKKGILSHSEIILGLPGETKESHLKTLRTLFDTGVGSIICYNCRTLEGTTLNTKQQREQYGIKTKYRLYDAGFGKYDSIVSIEADEVVRSTNALSQEDILFFRPLHWLIQFLWNYKYYTALIKYLWLEYIHPVDFMLQLLSNRKNAPDAVNKLLASFEEEARDEWFNTPEELFNYYSAGKNFDMIMKGGFGKLNYKYTFKVLCEMRTEFDVYLADTAKKMLKEERRVEAKEATYNIVDNLIRYMQEAYINFDDNLGFEKEKRSKFNYDIFQWERDSYKGALVDYYKPEGIFYLFYITDEQCDALMSNIKQFRHEDRNITLRKMSEYMNKADLFYKISRISDNG